MSNPIATPAAHVYRHQVAMSAATGAAISPAAFMVFGSSDRAYSPEDDTGAYAEFARVPVTYKVDGAVLTVSGTLLGTMAGDNVLREVAVLTAAGTLMGRRVVKNKEFEETTELEIDMDFEY